MNPNQPNGYQPYTGQYKNPQFNNYQFTNQPQFTQNNLNIPQSNNFNQGGTLSPTQNHQFNRNKVDRMMYNSTIQPTNTNKNFSFGKLQSMGRFVGNNDQPRNNNNQLNNEYTQSFNQHKQFGFQQNRQQKHKPLEQTNYTNSGSQFDRFPAFNLQEKSHQQQYNVVNNQGQYTNQQASQNSTHLQTPEQKRRRQIMAIKQQLEMINKKMQTSNMNRKYSNQIEKNDVKFSTNQGSNLNSNSNTLNVNSNNLNSANFNLDNNNYTNTNNNLNINSSLNTNNNSNINSSFGQQNHSQQNNYGNILQFSNRNAQLGVPAYERNKGLATQSMIVTNQPSPGYKYQSIFDKYDTLKKPTYQTTQAKQDRPLLLDKFVNKGLNIQPINKQKQSDHTNNSNSINTGNSFSASNNYNLGNGSTSNNFTIGNSNNLNSGTTNNFSTVNSALNYDFTSKFVTKSNDSSSSYTSNYTSSTSSNLSSGTQSNHSFEPVKQGGMFKKKKENPYIQQPKKETIPTSPKNTIYQDVGTFKKSKPQEDFITNAMKQMNVQQSVEFKRQDFVVGKKLGKGQFGEVMLVQHKLTGFLCGMKVMEKKQIRDEKYQGQIARQLSIQFYLAHRNIAPLYGYFQDQKNVYLLVQYCTGGQLLQLLRKNRRMQEPEVSRIIRQIIQGIDYIHKELIIHRDIKPQNILFNFGVAKICDYGWAVYKGHGMRKTASVGSPLYYSPEIVMGVEYDEKIDIWDIGMMTYECLLGKIPFRIYSQLDLNRIVEDEIKFPEYIDTTDEAKDFILKIMKKKPEQRMEIREMLRHPFITKYQELKLPVQIMKDFKEVLN